MVEEVSIQLLPTDRVKTGFLDLSLGQKISGEEVEGERRTRLGRLYKEGLTNRDLW